LLFQHISFVFSHDFIQTELKLATNIKDKNNRKNVIEILTLILGQLKKMSTEIIGDNGVLFLYGINRSSNLISKIISPPSPITEFYYKCNKHFDTDRFTQLFTTKPIGHVVFIDGEECMIYQYNGNWKKIKSITANLTKRHTKGGQSSVRFSRLAEESRANYITRVVDWINQLITINKNNFVFGGRELKAQLLASPELKISFKTDDVYHVFNDRTIHECYFGQIMINPIFGENRKIDNIIEFLNIDPDYLLFSIEDIHEKMNDVEYIVNIHLENTEKIFPNKQVIKLPTDHAHYAKLKDFIVIGKLYHK